MKATLNGIVIALIIIALAMIPGIALWIILEMIGFKIALWKAILVATLLQLIFCR